MILWDEFRGNQRRKTCSLSSYILFPWRFSQFSSVEFSHSVVFSSLQPHGLQQGRPSCPSSTPGVYPNPCPLSQWCHPTISSSVVPFSSHLQSFQASGSFQMSQFFASGSQIIGVSASTSVLPMNTQDWSPLGWTGCISLQATKLQKSSPTPQFKSISSSVLTFLYSSALTSNMTNGKTLTRRTSVGKVMSLLFNMLSKLVRMFLQRSKRLLISWLQPLSAVIFGAPQK